MIYEARINLRNKTKEELILFVEEGLQTIQKCEAELEKKEKIIDLMAGNLIGIGMYDDCEEGFPEVCLNKKQVKEYFTRCAEREGN